MRSRSPDTPRRRFKVHRGANRRNRPQVEPCERRILLASALFQTAQHSLLPARLKGNHSTRVPTTEITLHAATSSRSVARSSAVAFVVPGALSQAVIATFKLSKRQALYRSEIGIFLVDDASGRIGALTPGDNGYAAAAL